MKEKILALANHLNIDYFEHNGEYYIGATQKEYEEFEIKELETEDDTSEAFDEWIDSEYSTLEEEIENKYDNYYQYENQEYLVLTNSETHDAAYNSVMSIWEDCYLTKEIKKQLGFLKNYIDLESATHDAIRADGRGHTLASYDGYEYHEKVNEVNYYIYRIN